MSCCASCQTWPGCNDFLHGSQSGLGSLASLDLPPNQAGASFSLGVELNGEEMAWKMFNTDAVIEEIRLAVQQGGFVQVPIRVYKLSSWSSFNPFIVIEGRARYAHSSASHLRDAILSGVGSVIGFDAGSIRFEADTYDAATGLPNTDPTLRRYDAPTGGNNAAAPDPPKKFKWPDSIEQLATEFNTTPGKVVIGGIVVLFTGAAIVKRII